MTRILLSGILVLVLIAACGARSAAAQSPDDDLIRDISLHFAKMLLEEQPGESRTVRVPLRTRADSLPSASVKRVEKALRDQIQPDSKLWEELKNVFLDDLGAHEQTGDFLVHVAVPGPDGAYLSRSLLVRDSRAILEKHKKEVTTRVVSDSIAVYALFVPPKGADELLVVSTLTASVRKKGDPQRAALLALGGVLAGRLGLEAPTTVMSAVGPSERAVLVGRGSLPVPYPFAELNITWQSILIDKEQQADLKSLRSRRSDLHATLIDNSVKGVLVDKEHSKRLKQVEQAMEISLQKRSAIGGDFGPVERVSRSYWGASLAYSATSLHDVVVDDEGTATVEDPKTRVYGVANWFPWGYYSGGDGHGHFHMHPSLMLGARLDFKKLEPLLGVSLALRAESWTSMVSVHLWGGVTGRVESTTRLDGGITETREITGVWGVAVGLHP